MNKVMLLVFSAALLAVGGCRREDIREVTIAIPGLTEATRPQVVEALSRYHGVQADTYRWDMQAKTLTLRYDSMQVAQSNLRYAIEEKGLTVAYPVKTDDRAGY